MINTDNTDWMIHLKIDLYLQIKEHYEKLIKTGVFKAGEMLPSLRSVAIELGVNPNTVEKSFQKLADEGYVEIIPKKGAFVKQFIQSKESTPLIHLKELILELKKVKTTDQIKALITEILEDIDD